MLGGPRISRVGLVTRAVVALVVLGCLAAACSSDDDDGESGGDSTTTSAPADGDAATADGLTPQVGALPDAALEIMDGDAYTSARWSALVTEVGSDDPVLALWPDDNMWMGSNMKLFTVATALDVLGTDKTFVTPVHQVDGDLVLVASGDLVMGGRQADGDQPLGYSIPPQPDANGLPGAEPAPGDPLAGLDDLAQQVADSGVTQVSGDVLIDDRLFDPWDPADGPVSPIVINDNLLDVVVTPGGEGGAATLELIPDTAAFQVVNQVETVASGEDTSIDIEPGEGDNELIVSGTIESDSDPVLTVYRVPDASSYARTLFIEALGRAGVDVAADPLEPNSAGDLPSSDAYDDTNQVASITSPPYQQIAELIWKISHNEGANLSLCLLAVEAGSTDCTDGFAAIRDRTDEVGISPASTWFVDGAGGDPAQVSAASMVAWVQWMTEQDWADSLGEMLPIMGVDGSIGMIATDGPGKGMVQAKTGTSAAIDDSNGRLLIKGKSLAGLMESEDGTTYLFAVYMNNGSFDGLQDQFTVNDDLGNVAVAIQQSL